MKIFQRIGGTSQERLVDAQADARTPPVAPRSWLWVVTAGAAAIALGIAIVVLDWQLARPLAVLVLGITVAAALAPVVSFLERWLPRFIAVVLIYLCLALIVAAIGGIATPPLVSQASMAIAGAPALIGNVQQWLNQQLHLNTDSLAQ